MPGNGRIRSSHPGGIVAPGKYVLSVERAGLICFGSLKIQHKPGREVMGAKRKVAVLTGASRGLGEAIAKGYRDRNYCVVGTSRSILPSFDPDYLTIPADIADPAMGQRVIDGALDHFGRVDTLINNAGIFIPGPFHRRRSRS
jgi:hypothetical protein